LILFDTNVRRVHYSALLDQFLCWRICEAFLCEFGLFYTKNILFWVKNSSFCIKWVKM